MTEQTTQVSLPSDLKSILLYARMGSLSSEFRKKVSATSPNGGYYEMDHSNRRIIGRRGDIGLLRLARGQYRRVGGVNQIKREEKRAVRACESEAGIKKAENFPRRSSETA